jgi:hypothetical protein
MAQSGYTPIQLYYSTTLSAVPVNTNLVDGELAINTNDGKLFYKDSSGVVQVIATKGSGTIGGTNTQVQYNNSGALAGSSNFTFNGTTATINTLNLTNALGVAYGGTGLTSGTSGGVLYYSATGTLASSGLLSANALVIGGGAGVAPSTITTGTGVVTALGNNANATGGFTTINGTATLTNKRIDPRTSTSAATATLTPDISAFDQYNLTAQDQALTVAAPTGTPVDGNKLILRILDNGTARAITWNATYTVIGTTLPTTTTANKMVYVGCIYNSTNTRWDVVAVTTQA